MLMIFAIALFILFIIITLVAWDFTRAIERDKIVEVAFCFAREAENPASEKSFLGYTGPYEIGTDLIDVGFTAYIIDESARLSVFLNAGRRKPWWVLYEEFIKDETSGEKVRTECHKAEFHANIETAACLEILYKAAAGMLQPAPVSPPSEPVPDPFEMPPDDPSVATKA
ncbi:MAG: hypothetical protein AAB797_02895 [Patescibacteria group bacterium]